MNALGLNKSSWRLWTGAIAPAEIDFADFISRHDIPTRSSGERDDSSEGTSNACRWVLGG